MNTVPNDLLTKLSSCLCPPGNGVYTVNTARERKEKLHQDLFGTVTSVDELWEKSLNDLTNCSNAVILGVASDCGGGILRGANWGPLFLRSTLLANYPNLDAFDLGDIRVIPHLLHDKYLNDSTISNCQQSLYGKNITYPVSPLSITEEILHDLYAEFPEKGIFGIGGDHSVSYPLVKTYLQAKKKQGIKSAVIHFDAHTDLLHERLGIDLCFGSWCTHILDDLDEPRNLIQLGIRSSGKPQEYWENKFGVKQYWTAEIKRQGVEIIIEQIKQQLIADGIEELYVSFDIDAIDAKFASATGTPEPDGLYPDEVMAILRALAQVFKISGADMMEIAPFTDSTINSDDSCETTLAVAGEISAFLIAQIAKI
ncbi:arginase family protein [Thalassotalea crassostreae]|uniref:arginase family protein n=1 Tax=Thalassotalea crassostreae TaxID=1763536 RepID=UPI000837E47C|nr:arginase family protein [Thalassotalea crassostreae]